MIRKTYVLLLLLITFFLLAYCADPDAAYKKRKQEKMKRKRELAARSVVSALPLEVKFPKDNPSAAAKIALGKLLFFDPILSGNRDVACATCHHPNNGYAEFKDISIGVNGQGLGSKRFFKQPNYIPFLKRNAHTIINTGFNGIDIYNKYLPEKAPMFWDLRTLSLEKQALEPIKTFEEMRGSNFSEEAILPEVINRLKAIPAYQQQFQEVFKMEEAITAKNLGKAIATFERSLVANNTRFDQYRRGNEQAISFSEKDGFELFKKVGCANCHNGPMFSDYKVHVLGVPENAKLSIPDSGLEETFAFRTPSLRNLRFTAPYMHNGSLNTLQRVLEFYQDISSNKLRNTNVPKEQVDPLVHELNIRVKDMASIISFLNTLNDADFDKTIPDAVPSGLQVGGDIQ